MNPRYNANGQLSFWIRVPTRNLLKIVYRQLRKKYPQLNYFVDYHYPKPKGGYGFHATYLPEQKGVYHCPPVVAMPVEEDSEYRRQRDEEELREKTARALCRRLEWGK